MKKNSNAKTRNQRRFPSQTLMATINAKNVKKSKFYRSHLEPLLGKKAIVTGVISEWCDNKINGRWGLRLCFDRLQVLNHKCANTEHLWVNCDKGFVYRNNLKVGDTPVMKGTFYEYSKKDSYGNFVRNIGFRLDCILDKQESKRYKVS